MKSGTRTFSDVGNGTLSENGKDSETRKTFSFKPAKCALSSTAGRLEDRM